MRLSPKDFWSLSPAEWRWLIEAAAPAGGPGMTTGELAALALQYPDESGGAKESARCEL